MKKSFKKGFTLAEMLISMIVTLVLINLITTTIVVIIGNFEKNKFENEVHYDVNLAKTALGNWYHSFQIIYDGEQRYEFAPVNAVSSGEGTVYKIAEESSILAVYEMGTADESGAVVPYAFMYFDADEHVLYESGHGENYKANKIDSISFFKKASAIRVSIYYGERVNPLILILNTGEIG